MLITELLSTGLQANVFRLKVEENVSLSNEYLLLFNKHVRFKGSAALPYKLHACFSTSSAH